MIKKFFKSLPFHCLNKYCFDEITGVIAIILGAVAYIYQLQFSAKQFDMSSFSIVALFLTVLAEFFFLIQGIQKRSASISFTRLITTLAFTSFIVLWFITNRHKNKKLDVTDAEKNS